jgi:hypothetical protein
MKRNVSIIAALTLCLIVLAVISHTLAAPKQPTPQRFVDNGDGTISDNQTGLMWEKKNPCAPGGTNPDVHCVNSTYTWSATGINPDGNLFTEFLSNINRADGSSTDGSTIDRKNYSDWRIPNVSELRRIMDCTKPHCLDPVFGPTQDYYWSSTTSVTYSSYDAWWVEFLNGSVNDGAGKNSSMFVRAVRGGR